MTALESPIAGVVTALVTPFDERGDLDEDALSALVDWQIGAGVDGLCVLGGTGEPLALSESEQRRAIDCVITAARGRVPILVGAMLVNQSDIVRILRYAGRKGAAAGMLIAPYFIRASDRHVRQHFGEIARRTDLPLVIFNSPSRSGIDLSPTFLADAAREVDAIVAVKESSGDAARVAAVIDESEGRLSVLQGIDRLAVPSWELGATGAIVASACLVPDAFTSMRKAFDSGDVESARRIQGRIADLAVPLFRDGHPSPLKQALGSIGRPAGRTRPPIYPLAAEAASELDQEVMPLVGGLTDVVEV